METDFARITCPSCFQIIEVPAPALQELPADLDYDCEVCCRPMIIQFYDLDGIPAGEARGLDD
ncbi:MAG: CPXCG motif-containing cysteine-rich protein [Opitutales bacterium]|nr:CPXCG motif-containing cysteine-rich protein [Opitutales bacterium]